MGAVKPAQPPRFVLALVRQLGRWVVDASDEELSSGLNGAVGLGLELLTHAVAPRVRAATDPARKAKP